MTNIEFPSKPRINMDSSIALDFSRRKLRNGTLYTPNRLRPSALLILHSHLTSKLLEDEYPHFGPPYLKICQYIACSS